MKNIVAFDCGNSSFRVILGRYDGMKIETEVVEQVPNEMIKIHEFYYWDILMIFQKLMKGLKKAAKLAGKIDSIGICTWGVDFALFSKEKIMLNNPCSYRNRYGEEILNGISAEEQRDMFYETGILCDKINSVFLLKSLFNMVESVACCADKMLMIPDILNYMFTGQMVNEPSELSTTQMMDVKAQAISGSVCKKFEIPMSLFCPIGVHGTEIGKITKSIKEWIGVNYDIPVICVPSHDTASAVLAVPAEESFAFISSGTWALIGTELDAPIISEEIRNSGLTNEAGAFGKITLLKNSAGMFLMQRLKEEYESEKKCEIGWEEFNALGDKIHKEVPLFPVNSNLFFNPPSMSQAIWNYFIETRQVAGALNWPAVIKSFQVSMACSYASAIHEIEKACKRELGEVYIVGGGSQNTRLCQLAADYTGRPVVAGGKESTSLGNIAAQIKFFEPQKTIGDIRKIIKDSICTTKYECRAADAAILKKYGQLPT